MSAGRAGQARFTWARAKHDGKSISYLHSFLDHLFSKDQDETDFCLPCRWREKFDHGRLQRRQQTKEPKARKTKERRKNKENKGNEGSNIIATKTYDENLKNLLEERGSFDVAAGINHDKGRDRHCFTSTFLGCIQCVAWSPRSSVLTHTALGCVFKQKCLWSS